MTDRELLEMAAKAAGIRLEWDGNPREWQPMHYEGKTYHAWNPLTDDDLALRLAVKLHMKVEIWRSVAGGIRGRVVYGEGDAILTPMDEEIDAATRRAIVRAAAEIGKDGGART